MIAPFLTFLRKNRNLYVSLYIFILIGAFLFVSVWGFISLYSSPYTGITLGLCRGKPCIDSVDKGSPAEQAGVMPEDRIVDVNGTGIPDFAFLVDPYYLGSKNDLPLFWEAQRKLGEMVAAGRPLKILIERGERRLEFYLTPIHHFPLAAASKIIYFFFSSWLFMFLSYLILRKKRNEATVLFFTFYTVLTMGDTANIFQLRNISFPYLSFRVLEFLSSAFASFTSPVVIHLALVFPERVEILKRYPRLIAGLYSVSVLIFFLSITGIVSRYRMGYFPIVVSSLLFPLLLLYRYFRFQDTLLKRQSQWVILGFTAPWFAGGLLNTVPKLIFGQPILRGDHLIFFILYWLPIAGMAIAVTRYRLFDIDELIDYSLIYGATMLFLFGIEFSFLSYLSPIYSGYLHGNPYLSTVPAVLIIVIFYIPLRNRIKRLVERLFKRGSYEVQEELQRFILSAGLCSEVSVLERFTKYVNRLLGPSGVLIIRAEHHSHSVFLTEGKIGEEAIREVVSAGEGLCRFLKERRCATYGYELVDKGVMSAGADPDGEGRRDEVSRLESSLFIPVTSGENCSHIIVLLPKWNKRAYSRRDRALLDAIAVNISYILEAEDIRRDKVSLEKRHLQERDDLMKEMHDGLGSLLTNITVASQAAGSVIGGNPERAKDLYSMISVCSREAFDCLRTGLTVLNNQEGKMGMILSDMRYRLCGHLEKHGVKVAFDTVDGIGDLSVGSRANLQIVRCLQETFANVLKHSGARVVSVRFRREGESLKIAVEDDGRGFDPNRVKTSGGFGLKNISKRMEDLGGAADIHSSPGGGTRVILSIPLNSPPSP